MKFGKLLRRQALAKWSKAYVDYKRLKQLLKAAPQQSPGPLPTALFQQPEAKHKQETVQKLREFSQFFQAVGEELDKVDQFFRSCLDEWQPGLTALTEQIAAHHASASPGSCTSEQHQRDLSSCCQKLDDLRAYVVLNYLAFCKILKKFDKRALGVRKKKAPGVLGIKDSVLLAVQEKGFYSSKRLANMLTEAQCAAASLAGDAVEAEDFQCPVCLHTLGNPVVLSCAHRFCWHCLAQASLFSQCCPVCRKKQSLNPRHYKVDRTLKSFLSTRFPQFAQPEAEMGMEDSYADDEEAVTMSVDAQSEDCSTGMDLVPASPSCKGAEDSDDECVPVPGLHRIARIGVLLKHKSSHPLMVVDIDETLVMSCCNSLLLTRPGIDAFQQAVQASGLPVHEQQRHYSGLQRVLDDKVLCEPNTAHVIHQLQARGCWVLGLTSRYTQQAAATQITLAKHNMDFNKSAPSHLPRTQALQDPETGAVYCNGVIYTNAIDKAAVLNRFLDNVIFTDDPDAAGSACSAGVAKPQFSELVFIDDRPENVRSVFHNLKAAARRNIPVTAYLYSGGTNQCSLTIQACTEAELRRVAALQVDTFLKTRRVVSDEEAVRTLGLGRASRC